MQNIQPQPTECGGCPFVGLRERTLPKAGCVATASQEFSPSQAKAVEELELAPCVKAEPTKMLIKQLQSVGISGLESEQIVSEAWRGHPKQACRMTLSCLIEQRNKNDKRGMFNKVPERIGTKYESSGPNGSKDTINRGAVTMSSRNLVGNESIYQVPSNEISGARSRFLKRRQSLNDLSTPNTVKVCKLLSRTKSVIEPSPKTRIISFCPPRSHNINLPVQSSYDETSKSLSNERLNIENPCTNEKKSNFHTSKSHNHISHSRINDESKLPAEDIQSNHLSTFSSPVHYYSVLSNSVAKC